MRTDSRHRIDVLRSDTKDSLRANPPRLQEFRQSTEVNTVSYDRVVARSRGSNFARGRTIACAVPLVLGAIVVALAGSTRPTPVGIELASITMLADAPGTPDGAQPRLASDPAQLADDLVADENALRDPS